PGNFIKLSGDSHLYTVATVPDATHLTLTSAYFGPDLGAAVGTDGLTYQKVQPGVAATQVSFPVDIEGFTPTGQEDSASAVPGMCIKIDNTPPKLLSATTRDINYNGLLDEI